MSKPKLIYFALRGLAEPIRVLLADAQVDYEEAAFSSTDKLAELKANGLLAFDQVPLWQEPNGFSLVQSSSILRYLARKHGLNGKNEQEAAHVDAFWEYYKDITTAVGTAARNPDSVKREELKKKLIEEDLPKHLARLEGLLKKNGTGYFVGDSISYADLGIWYLLDNYSAQGLIDYSKYEKLVQFKKTIDSRPGIQKYLNNPNRYPVSYAFPRYVIYAYENNVNSFKALIAAQYGGLKIEYPKFQIGVDNKTPEFLKKNPNGQVPTLDSPDGPIFESNAIARYIARKGSDKALLGTNEYEASQIDQWIEWTRSKERDLLTWVLPVFGYGAFDQEKYDASKKAAAAGLAILNGHLEGKEWIVGKRISLADIITFATYYLNFTTVTDPEFIKPFPHVVAWANRCSSQPQFKAVIGDFKFTDQEKKAAAK